MGQLLLPLIGNDAVVLVGLAGSGPSQELPSASQHAILLRSPSLSCDHNKIPASHTQRDLHHLILSGVRLA